MADRPQNYLGQCKIILFLYWSFGIVYCIITYLQKICHKFLRFKLVNKFYRYCVDMLHLQTKQFKVNIALLFLKHNMTVKNTSGNISQFINMALDAFNNNNQYKNINVIELKTTILSQVNLLAERNISIYQRTK